MENEKYRQKSLLTNVRNAKNGQYMESTAKEIKEDVQNMAKSFHMTLIKLDKNFVVVFRHVGSCL